VKHFIITCDNAIVGSFQYGSVELNNIFVAQDTQNLSLDEVKKRKKKTDAEVKVTRLRSNTEAQMSAASMS